MARRSPRPNPVFFVTAFTIVIAVAVTWVSTPAAQRAAADAVRIAAVANLTVRASASPDAAVVAFVPLGTEFGEANPAGLDKTWRLVRLGDGREGWVHARLTKPVDPAWPWPVYDEIMAERLGRTGDGFSSAAELVSFIERVRPTYNDPESRARVELARLRAVSRAAAAVPFNASKREPYASWLSARANDVVYDEPGGRWMVPAPVVWDVHTRHARTAAADDMAWFAVTSGLPGECEGFVACYFAAQDRLAGEYLRRHPSGRHAPDAVDAIAALVTGVAGDGRFKSPYEFDPKTDCAELAKGAAGLLAAVRNANTGQWNDLVDRLEAVRGLCR